LLDHLRPLEKGACNDIIPDAVESDAVFTCNTRNLAATGDPNGSGAAPWLAYDAGENILQLDNSIVNLAAFYPPAILAIRFLHTTYLPGGVVEPRRKTAPLPSRFGRVEQEWNQMGPTEGRLEGVDI